MNITLQFTYTYADFKESIHHRIKSQFILHPEKRGFLFRSPLARRLTWLALALVLVMATYLRFSPPPYGIRRSNSDATFATFVLIAAPVFALLILAGKPLLISFLLRRNLKNNPQQTAPRTAQLTLDQLSITRPGTSTQIQWNQFLHFFETQNLFILYTSPDFYVFLPKRAFPSPADLETFRTFAHSHIGPRSSGFPVDLKSQVRETDPTVPLA